ncbi:hypothetical protein K491DRAFT_88924 [Lophiostoma macrostomum CBS 122681]|uniref:Uncharacterized protein n=1 Tax=Lophiostoma macrostomum CBS 122681 TaxID=1314788 RepID=A0A6A6SUS7_9PLEO|nr:hypothetical protein K491DRAFT_88924 [Lophiostoma macrostomum CBS 122681]
MESQTVAVTGKQHHRCEASAHEHSDGLVTANRKAGKLQPKQAVTDVSKVNSRSLGTRILALPQELQLIIWKHYWLGDPDQSFIHRTFRSTELWELKQFLDDRLRDPMSTSTCPNPHKCTCFTPRQLPSAVLPALVGQAVAQAATTVGLQLLYDWVTEAGWRLCQFRVGLHDLPD